jgi:N-succinyldiaminopimelate aminotransferase
MAQFGGGSNATVTLWQRTGVKVLPGCFLAQTAKGGINPGKNYVRVALVQDLTMLKDALGRMIELS